MYSHRVFKETSPSAKSIPYPLVSDRNLQISKAYRVLDSLAGTAFRATIFIDPEGIITAKIIYPKEVGRNSYEILRMMQGILYGKGTGLSVPANWVPGASGIQPNINSAGKY